MVDEKSIKDESLDAKLTDITPAKKDFVDVKKVIGNKNPRLLKMMPGFIIRYLKRTIHQDEINEFIRAYGHYYGLEFANKIIEAFGINVVATGTDNIPVDGRYIISANHPLGGLDGIALITMAGKIRKDILFPVNDILMNLENLKELFIPINKHGSNAENIAIIDGTFNSDVVILYFPAGLVSRKQKKGIIKDLDWKKTFITKARKSKRNIVPAHIDGQNTNFFYNLARFRKRIGMKQNIEMLYLVDELYKQRGKTIHITFGKPIPYETFDRRFNDAAWAAKIKEHVYNLETEPNRIFNP
jgi:putative hemolysin